MAVVKLVATLSSYASRAVVVGGMTDRYASELARAGQSNRRRAGTGSASPERATRPPLWPAGMAEGNRATFGPRVGLSSHGSPAKGGPKSKCLARLKIARTSAGPPSLTISDLSRFSRSASQAGPRAVDQPQPPVPDRRSHLAAPPETGNQRPRLAGPLPISGHPGRRPPARRYEVHRGQPGAGRDGGRPVRVYLVEPPLPWRRACRSHPGLVPGMGAARSH